MVHEQIAPATTRPAMTPLELEQLAYEISIKGRNISTLGSAISNNLTSLLEALRKEQPNSFFLSVAEWGEISVFADLVVDQAQSLENAARKIEEAEVVAL